MNTHLPLNRRARNWYGTRTPPSAEPRWAPGDDRRLRTPQPAVSPLPPEIRQAPVDRRLTALL
jgi:hypothetical protein